MESTWQYQIPLHTQVGSFSLKGDGMLIFQNNCSNSISVFVPAKFDPMSVYTKAENPRQAENRRRRAMQAYVVISETATSALSD